MLVVGIDVGGTHIKFGLVEDGKIIKSMEFGTNAFDIIRQLCNGAREIVQDGERSWNEVDGVAVGFPGMVIDSVVLDSPNISLQNCNLKEILENELGKTVVVKNDAEMATIAEHKMGAGADCDNMVLITLGTGVGGGIIVDKKLYVGAGGAGELGHIMFEKNGKPCTCGRKGCAEQYVSMRALDSLAKDIMLGYPNTCVDFNGDGQIYASELTRAYKRNDSCAIEIVDKFVDNLTQFLLDLCNLFRPNRIVIGGGVTHAPELIDMVARNCRRLEYGYRNSPKVDILAAQLGNQAGVLGGYVCLKEELMPNDVEEYAPNFEEMNSQQQNLSLLDSISRRLDKQMGSSRNSLDSVVGVDNNSFMEDNSGGMYVNKVLDDISTEINIIKNEQLLGDLDDNEESYQENSVGSIYQESVDNTIEEPIGIDNSTFMSAVSDISDVASVEPSMNNEFVEQYKDSIVEDVSESNEEDEYDSEENLSLGLNDIFFGTTEEHEDKLDKIDISNVNIIDNNIVETAPVIDNTTIESASTETFQEVPSAMVGADDVTTDFVSDIQNDDVIDNYFAPITEPVIEQPPMVDNSIFVPPTNNYVDEVVVSEPTSTMDTVPYEAVDGNAAVVEEQFNNVQTTDPVDFVGESVNNDYAQLLDAMTRLDATDAVGANTSGPENVNLLSRVSQMLDNKDQQ